MAANNSFLADAHNMYEHTACELHGEADCGCGHLNNLRKKATIFGLDDELIAYHQVLMKTKAITPHALADKHREKGVLIIMGSQSQDDEGKEHILTILSNTLGESDQFFVVNMDALNIITDETAKRYSEIITNLYPSIAQKIETDHKGKGESLHNIVRTYLTRGLYTQTIDTAKALASQLEDNTFIINGKDITPMKLSNVFSLMETTT
ncbi:MAG: hypothetical protein H6766_08080 [Candidatus Peribacteria bacterium]|nr:MAG: hypothetical protein H6766_08080 [Candidatus Peribacteria bacterium]